MTDKPLAHFTKKINFEVTPLLKEEQRQNPPKYVRFDLKYDGEAGYGRNLERSFNPLTDQEHTGEYIDHYHEEDYLYGHKLTKYEELKMFAVHFKWSKISLKKSAKEVLELAYNMIQVLVMRRLLDAVNKPIIQVNTENTHKQSAKKTNKEVYKDGYLFGVGILDDECEHEIHRHSHHASDLRNKNVIEHGR